MISAGIGENNAIIGSCRSMAQVMTSAYQNGQHKDYALLTSLVRDSSGSS